ncbi:MAG: T9SS type A sorting domain-containing protein [Flavobacterium sp.]|nr:T9SS type A sorting domain-containing protein [Flavobacterium sp.]
MKKIFLIAILAIVAQMSFAQGLPSYVPTNGLVGYWGFNGNADDQSGNAKNGTVTGATLTSDRFGSANSAYNFSGAAQFITCPSISELNGSSSASFSLWVKINGNNLWTNCNLGCAQYLLSRDGDFSSTNIGINYGPVNKLFGGRVGSNGSGIGTGSTNTYPVPQSTWHHIVFNIGGGFLKLYVDGVFNSSSVFNGVMPSSSSNLFFGKQPVGRFEYYLNGFLDDIGIWNRALTQEEITALYQGCALSVTTQPTNQATNLSNNAQFTVVSSDPDATYQWQTDLGVGFQNISNAGQYTGATTSALTIANTTLSNNNQLFRCVIAKASCTDTSSVATLIVNEAISSYVPADGLVGYWPFNGNANDESGNGNNGTVNGATLATDRFGNNNKAYYFNGQSSITVNSTNQISNNINDELSISVWFKLDSYFNGISSTFSPLISKNGPYWHQYEFFVTSTAIGFWGPNIYQEQGVNFQFNLNNWNNVIIVFKSGIIKYYLNSVLVGTNTVPVSSLQPSSNSVLEMGMDTANQVEYLNGSLDDIGIWNRALTQEEITQLYTTTPAPTALSQTFCGPTTVASLVATGTDLKWYITETGGTALASDVTLASGTYYVSQTLNNLESDRTEVVVTINEAQITASANTVSSGTEVNLTASTSLSGSVTSVLPSNLQTGLMAFYPFNGNANDTSINGNNPTINTIQYAADRNGNANSAGLFLGEQYAIVPNSSSLNVAGDFSVASWVYLNNDFPWTGWWNTQAIFTKDNDYPYGAKVFITPEEDSLAIGFGTSTWDANQGFGTKILRSQLLGAWHHFTWTYDNNVGKLFLDGTLILSQSATPNWSTANTLDLHIAVNGDPAGNYPYKFLGKMDDLGFWSRSLSSSEISQLSSIQSYLWSTGETTATITPSPTATTTYWCDVTVNGVTCRKEMTVTVRPLAPTATAQTLCGETTVANIVATGTDLKWYATATGGTALASDVALSTGTYYVSQTLNTIESDRTAVAVTINEAQITASANTVSSGTAVTLTASTSSSTGSSTLPANLQNGLVGYWPFNGDANDASRNGNNGTVNGATLTTDRFGNSNGAYSFDGLNDYINIPNSNSLNFGSNLNFSVSFFYQPLNQNSFSGLISKMYPSRASVGPRVGWQIIQENSNIGFESRSGNSLNEFENNLCRDGQMTPISPNKFNHCVIVFDRINGKIKFYVDNVLIRTNSCVEIIENVSNVEPLLIGVEREGWFYSSGKIDDISIHNHALSPDEIALLYSPAPSYTWSTGENTASITPSPTETTTYWCDVTVNGVTCRKEMTIIVKLAVISPINYCHKSTAVPLTATPTTGSTLKWYATATSKTALATAPTPTTTTVGSKTYYVAERTAAGVESERLPIVVNINPLPTPPTAIQVTDGSNSITKVGPFIGTTTPLTLSTSATNATSFDWILPKGVVVTSAVNSNTTDADGVTTANASGNITINFSGVPTGLETLYIKVKSVGNCGVSNEKKIGLTRALPSTPGTISTTNSNVCFGIVGTPNKVTYSIAPVAGAFAQGYIWTVPTGATIVTPFANASTMTYGTEIEVSYDSSFVSGFVTVKASNGVGVSRVKVLSVMRRVPSSIASITAPLTFCVNETATITVPSIPGVTYLWSATNNTNLTAEGNSVTASFENTSSLSAYTSLTVSQYNGCGYGTSKKVTLRRGSCTTSKINSQNRMQNKQFNAFVYPNPSSTAFEVTTNTEEAFDVRVYDLLGRLIEEQNGKGNNLKIGANYQSGTYILKISQGENQKTLQVIKK